jgi:hypothetical protein
MRLLFSLIICVFLFSCNSKNIPDVSNVKVNLKTERFEQAFFAIDTNNVSAEMDKLMKEYPTFVPNFVGSILGGDPLWRADTAAAYVKGFITYNRTVYDTAQKYFSNFSAYEKELKKGLQFVKHYFPQYKIPTKIITYIGPADGYGDILDNDALIVGLQAHLGKDFPLYKTDMVRGVYPDYITARFTPDYIAVNAMRNIVNDMYPEKNDDKRLIIQMIEKGKRLWLLSKFLPETDEYKLIGYTKVQMKDCDEHQSNIWSLFIQNNFLQTADNNLIKNYVSEGPKTQELGEGAPGNIGSYAGWQIVKKYVDKNNDIKPNELMVLDNEKLYIDAKYKP